MKKSSKKIILFFIIIIIVLTSIIFIINNPTKKTKTIETENGCKKTGCSGNLCIEANQEDIITTCEWKEEYGCYQKVKCEKQSDGKCGFTKDEELNNCLNEFFQKK